MQYQVFLMISIFSFVISCGSSKNEFTNAREKKSTSIQKLAAKEARKEPKKCQRIKDIEKRQICWIEHCNKEKKSMLCTQKMAEAVLRRGERRNFCALVQFFVENIFYCGNTYLPKEGRFHGTFINCTLMSILEDGDTKNPLPELYEGRTVERKGMDRGAIRICERWQTLFIKARCELSWERTFANNVYRICQKMYPDGPKKAAECEVCMHKNPRCPEWGNLSRIKKKRG